MAFHRAALLSSIFLFSNYALAVTVIPLTLAIPRTYKSDTPPASSPKDLLFKLDPSLSKGGVQNVVASSYSMYEDNINETSGVYAAQDSVIRGAIDASAKHQHLVLRPDDIWYTILTQLGFYMREHKDDQLLPPKNDGWGVIMIPAMGEWVDWVSQQRSRAAWVLDWLKPNTTTLPVRSMGTRGMGEEMMAKEHSAVFMAASTPSHEAIEPFSCRNGIPSVTLLGDKADWIQLSSKVRKMETGALGVEPSLYALSLRPLVNRFLLTFDIPHDPAIRLFWNDMITATPLQPLCQTTDKVTGWINGFHFWDPLGNILLPQIIIPSTSSSSSSSNNNNNNNTSSNNTTATPSSNNTTATSSSTNDNNTFQIDNIGYPNRKTKDLPTALGNLRSCISMDSPWAAYTKTTVGMMAKRIKKGVPEAYKAAMREAGAVLLAEVAESDHSILQAEPVWFSHSELFDYFTLLS
ncbi:hypothetical protein EJ08DRAFT_677630 [Tothia fuscella]|uniref:Uncharacterized protein n=1 Tax=Tothia fuscella TaxID=1048955 RepID=A0A9P4NVC9_9PEZI|nr:hypothetical protein EJ08DRAFT_677630 [Tothia fuscella]